MQEKTVATDDLQQPPNRQPCCSRPFLSCCETAPTYDTKIGGLPISRVRSNRAASVLGQFVGA